MIHQDSLIILDIVLANSTNELDNKVGIYFIEQYVIHLSRLNINDQFMISFVWGT